MNSASTLFRAPETSGDEVSCGGLGYANLFCLAGSRHIDLTRWLCAAALLVTASGWRPRVTGPVHAWIAVSFFSATQTPDGGDQVGAVLSLILLPLCITDSRRWHWTRLDHATPSEAALIARLALIAARVQVAGIYFQSSVAKLGVREWADGSAVYYWFNGAIFGFPSWMSPFVALLDSAVVVATLTWGTVALEFALSVGGLFGKVWVRNALLVAGIALRLSIGIFLGLPSFAVAMFAALILLNRRPDEEFEVTRRAAALAATVKVRKPSVGRVREEKSPSASGTSVTCG